MLLIIHNHKQTFCQSGIMSDVKKKIMSGNCSENSAFSYIAISAPHFFLSRTQNILGIKNVLFAFNQGNF